MAHWVYIVAVASGPAAFAVWRLARAFLLIMGGLTKDSQRSMQCERMIILSRGDAKEVLRSLSDSPDSLEPHPTGQDQVEAGFPRSEIVSETPPPIITTSTSQ